MCRHFGLFSSSMYLTWCHCTLSCTFALLSFTRLLQCSRWSSQTPDFTRIETAVSASFALRMKRRCCGDVRVSLRLDIWNFGVSSGMSAAAVATACCFHSVPLMSYPTLAAPAGSLNLRCLNCVFVSHVFSDVFRSLSVRVRPTQVIERCFTSILNYDLPFVQRKSICCAMSWIFFLSMTLFMKSALLLFPGIFRIVASRLWKTPCTRHHWVSTCRTFPTTSHDDMSRPESESVSNATLTSCP